MEIVDVRYVGSNDQYQTYAPSDVSLINTALITANYGGSFDYIEYFIKDLSGTVLSSNYYATQYNIGSEVDSVTGTTTQLFLDPEKDARDAGYNRGIVNVKYNFFQKQLQSAPNPLQNFWIKEVSTTRTEIKVARQDLSNTELQSAFTAFNTVLSADAYYPDFYLDFGADVQLIGINAVYVEEDGSGYIIFKLYEPLPSQFDVKSTFWVVTQVADPAEFSVSINVTPDAVIDTAQIKGPNFKVQLNDKVGQTTPYYTYASLFQTAITSSYQQLQSIMQEKGIEINVDYGNFQNFIHFSSATERIHNFVYKAQLIESASAGLNATNTSTAKVLLQSQIDSIITNFDGYEYYLYYTSASTAWPKQNGTQPYVLYSVTSSQAVNWLGTPSTTPTSTATMSMYYSSSYYDDQNKDLLLYATPGYILEDSANAPYMTFLNMIGQHFDNIWIYLKDVTNHYSAENNPFVGISLDQVADALRSFGIQLYTNTSITDNIYYSLLGINQTGSNLPVTSSNYSTVVYASSSLYPLPGNEWLSSSLYLPPFGEEKINQYVITFTTASTTVTSSFETLPASQITGEIYKRIYHNLAYLLKTRGTERGVKALIATFGIPTDSYGFTSSYDSLSGGYISASSFSNAILTPHEYGGYNYQEVPGLQEISNIKILTGSVPEISSSLLSPNATIQFYQNNIEKTSINVEVAFTPADSINASITSSGYVTSSTQPGYFNIMQLIGDPTLQYTNTYVPLEEVKDIYFTAEYPNKNNVWDFIRIIKYYNNSLFKMLRDWVPARTSPSTGIVIKSHMLERNKYPRHEPTYTTSSLDGDIPMVIVEGSSGGSVEGSTAFVEGILVQYNGTASMALTGSPGIVFMSSSNDVQKYNGQFDGTTIQTSYNYFPQTDVSSYIYPWTSSIPGPDQVLFLTYSLSPLFENVMIPVRSQRFYDLDYNATQLAPTNYGLITQSMAETILIGNVSQSQQKYSQYAYIQDFNYYSRPYTIPRYSGSYLSGQYNTYSPTDISYGTDPVINYYSDKLGFFTQVQTSSFLPGQVNMTLGYLADVSGGLFELNQNNKHWQDVQNIFKAGTTLTIKQFDNKKYSNQKSTDGPKTIYNSGYSYTPQLYYLSGSDQKIYFQYVGSSSPSNGFTAINGSSPNLYISGASNPYYSASVSGDIHNIFDTLTSPGSIGYTPGGLGAFPQYSPSFAEILTFTANFGINIAFPVPNQTISYTFDIKLNSAASILPTGPITQTFTSVQTSGTNNSIGAQKYGSKYSLVLLGGTQIINGTVSGKVIDLYVGSSTTPSATETLTSGQSITISDYDLVYEDGTTTQVTAISQSTPPGIFSGYTAANNASAVYYPGILPEDELTGAVSFNTATVANSYEPGDIITFELSQNLVTVTNSNFTASIELSPNSLAGKVATIGEGGYPYATASLSVSEGWFIADILNDTNLSSTVVFDTEISNFYQYQQVPAFITNNALVTSSLYSLYGDISYPFYPQAGDKLLLTDFSGITQNLDILTSFLSGSRVCVRVIPQVTPNWIQNPALIYKLLMLKRYDDEQNVILTFNKNPGQTSYGFGIPDTISPVVTANINTLQAAVQSQLLSNQSLPSTDVINGGTFGGG
jgi:hypothetical protein